MKKKRSRSKANIVKIQVEAKAPRRRSRKKKTKKKTKKKVSKRKSRVSAEKVQIQMQPVLVDNFVALQKVMVNLAGKMDSLNTQVSELLNLFELSAKSLAKKGFKLEAPEGAPSKEVMTKLNELSEQNKVIARGLTLMHEAAPAPAPMPAMPPAPAPAPAPMPTPAAPKAPEAEYKRSAPSKPAPKKAVKKASKK